MADTAVPTPNQYRGLRACMVCSIVQLLSKFKQAGCPNCESFLQLQGNEDAIDECTSQVFEGLITLTEPKKSWVAKWQRLDNYEPGNYAVKVVGTLPEDVLGTMEDQGITFIPRDGSYVDDATR